MLYLGPDGSVLMGEPADRYALGDPSRIVREFKRRIGDPVPVIFAGTAYSPQMLASRLMRWVVNQTTELAGAAPSEIALTPPGSGAS